MSHFAKVMNTGRVERVIVAEQDFIDTLPDKESWIQTSYNSFGGVHFDPETGEPSGKPHFRWNYAEVDGFYDKQKDAFIPRKPPAIKSWVLNEKMRWSPPIPMPELTEEEVNQGFRYLWHDNKYKLDNTQGWVLTKI